MPTCKGASCGADRSRRGGADGRSDASFSDLASCAGHPAADPPSFSTLPAASRAEESAANAACGTGRRPRARLCRLLRDGAPNQPFSRGVGRARRERDIAEVRPRQTMRREELSMGSARGSGFRAAKSAPAVSAARPRRRPATRRRDRRRRRWTTRKSASQPRPPSSPARAWLAEAISKTRAPDSLARRAPK